MYRCFRGEKLLYIAIFLVGKMTWGKRHYITLVHL